MDAELGNDEVQVFSTSALVWTAAAAKAAVAAVLAASDGYVDAAGEAADGDDESDTTRPGDDVVLD